MQVIVDLCASVIKRLAGIIIHNFRQFQTVVSISCMFSMVQYNEMIFEYVTDVSINALSHEFSYSDLVHILPSLAKQCCLKRKIFKCI